MAGQVWPELISENLQKAGAIVSPCNPLFREWELQYQLKDMQPRVIVLLDAKNSCEEWWYGEKGV